MCVQTPEQPKQYTIVDLKFSLSFCYLLQDKREFIRIMLKCDYENSFDWAKIISQFLISNILLLILISKLLLDLFIVIIYSCLTSSSFHSFLHHIHFTYSYVIIISQILTALSFHSSLHHIHFTHPSIIIISLLLTYVHFISIILISYSFIRFLSSSFHSFLHHIQFTDSYVTIIFQILTALSFH
jgi:hypothetical protein